jgi:RNA recognition motif-containing protein
MNIYVGNLSPNITEDELRVEFLAFGVVTSVILMNDQGIGSGQGRGCGYIEMPSVSEGESAIDQLQGKLVRGRRLDIIKALPVTKNYNNETERGSKISGFSRKPKCWGSKWSRT